MKIFLSGGGSGETTAEAMKKLREIIDKKKPLLYIPLAMNEDRYPECLEWIKSETKSIGIKNINMIVDPKELVKVNYNDYCAIFIGGGNTYKLLNDIKLSGAFNKIKEYIENDGIVFGSSAGAIIFGKDIDTCKYEDNNEMIGLEDTIGFDVLNGVSLLCHFNKTEEQTQLNTKYLLEYSKKEKVIYLPESNTIYINNKNISIIGTEKSCIFENGKKRIIDLSSEIY